MVNHLPRTPLRWYRSLYWRIGLIFVVFVVAVIIAQSAIFSYRMMRRNAEEPDRSPNNLATTVASNLGSALAENPDLDLTKYLTEHYGREPWRVFVVMSDGRVAGNSTQTLPEAIRQSAEATLAGTDLRKRGAQPRLEGPVIMAPIPRPDAAGGMVVLPPPPPRAIRREIAELLSLPGTLLLIAATVLAAVLIFAPARRRLGAVERAAVRLGSGDLAARAPGSGGDEIARVARAFNQMADELVARDEALRAADRQRRQMLADVSHELKTPLTALRGYLETLRMGEIATDADARARYLETAERETHRLERIVRDLLDLAQYENGVGTLHTRLFATSRVFEHVLRRHERDAEMRHITLRSEVADAADQTSGDPDRLEQVIDNLVGNALRHTPEGGTVDLHATAEAGAIRLSVVDSGDGIASEHLPHVFDRFYKVDGSRVAGSAGSGLGLSIAKAIVERHGGTIHVTSVPGRTEFRIVLPQ